MTNSTFTINHFIRYDEVYLIGADGEPFGMVVKIGAKNIHVKSHNNSKTIVVKPTNLYLGKEWHLFNN